MENQKRVKVSELLKMAPGLAILVKGWVRTKEEIKTLHS
jgi:hypothetical protein